MALAMPMPRDMPMARAVPRARAMPMAMAMRRDMATPGIYGRPLPSTAINLFSSEGKQLRVEANQNGTMEVFFRLCSHSEKQAEPTYCGLASLSMVLNALGIDPGRIWKEPWRWFDQSMLDFCEPLEKVEAKGMSFGKLVCSAHCAGANVEAFRTNHCNIDDFRNHVMKCTVSDDCYMISSYDRGVLKQAGTGHFSPIGGYHAGRDMVLILDVARFKYPPHWVRLTDLWEAMDHIDEATGRRRGFLLISRLDILAGVRYTVVGYSVSNSPMPLRFLVETSSDWIGESVRYVAMHLRWLKIYELESWASIKEYLVEDIPLLLKSEYLEDVQNMLFLVYSLLPSNSGKFIKRVVRMRRNYHFIVRSLSQEEKGRLDVKQAEVLKLVQETGLFKYVAELLSSEIARCKDVQKMCPTGNDFLTAFLLPFISIPEFDQYPAEPEMPNNSPNPF